MGNPLKGAVAFELDGEKLLLSYSAEALYRLEDALDMRVSQLIGVVGNREAMSMKLLRTFFWAGLLDNKPEMTLDEVGSYFRRIAPVDMIELVTQAFSGAFVDPKKVPPAGDTPAGP
ncbi:hypothetical protein [Bradyrhizobium sp. SZCCHNS3002]|uniref:hypothetical protein n=1 Tax=Bradyrhizobium sp. SZCCHNS3002 TaxID=3057310 RepID=UPI0028E4A561|nr:hypothetical protein [Bradyrhizobium sp. SZCCHNS3002]